MLADTIDLMSTHLMIIIYVSSTFTQLASVLYFYSKCDYNCNISMNISAHYARGRFVSPVNNSWKSSVLTAAVFLS